MNLSGEFLGMLMLVAAVAALGLSVVFDAGRASAERARLAMLQRQQDKKRTALSEWRAKTERKAVELKAHQARLTEFLGQRQKVLQEIKAIEFTKIELIHEFGDQDQGSMGFWSLLVVTPNFAGAARHDILFSRQIWDYRNVAHVWAPSSDQAKALLESAFSLRSGVQPTQMLPLAFAPDATAAEPRP